MILVIDLIRKWIWDEEIWWIRLKPFYLPYWTIEGFIHLLYPKKSCVRKKWGCMNRMLFELHKKPSYTCILPRNSLIEWLNGRKKRLKGRKFSEKCTKLSLFFLCYFLYSNLTFSASWQIYKNFRKIRPSPSLLSITWSLYTYFFPISLRTNKWKKCVYAIHFNLSSIGYFFLFVILDQDVCICLIVSDSLIAQTTVWMEGRKEINK